MSKQLKFGNGEDSFSKESLCYVSNNKTRSFDYLIFVDSRGLVINESSFEHSYLFKIMQFLDNAKASYVCVSRPKNLTVFATLYNFLVLNPALTFTNLITNLGFVDCTPKKEAHIQDIQLQINEHVSIELTQVVQENYLLLNGHYEMLKTLSYNEKYISEIARLLNERFTALYFIATPIITDVMNFERKRPNSFFLQLRKTNELLGRIIEKLKHPTKLLDVKNATSTYDGVHFDRIGHEKIFTELKEKIAK
ncbi:MAG: hypothetical protein QG641_1023 [Candidatus Poribacteria bacterium]|nr:hypothetical protein [Candidatus Poribacteria bacterium]